MSGTPVRVKVAWGKKETKPSIKINAKTLGGALEELEKRDEWGEFDGKIGYAYDADENDIVTNVTIKPSYTIHMPVWSGYKKAPKECQQEWDRMYKKLAEHEEKHRLFFLETFAMLTDAFEHATDLTVSQFIAEYDRLLAEGQSNQDKFDDATDHGGNKGVELTITEACE